MVNINAIASYVNSNLLQKKNIKVQDEWLEACIEWLHEESDQVSQGLSQKA